MELLAGVVRAKEPLGHEGEQHQRRQQRGGLAQVAAELPVKDVAHARLAGQHHEPEEHQHAGSAARDADEHRQQCGGGQAGQLMRLPHIIKEPVAADQAVAEGQSVLLVDFQPRKGASQHNGSADKYQNQRQYAVFTGLRHQAPPPFKVLCSRVSRRQYQ